MQILGNTFHRGIFDLESEQILPVIPSLHDDALQLIHVSSVTLFYFQLMVRNRFRSLRFPAFSQFLLSMIFILFVH